MATIGWADKKLKRPALALGCSTPLDKASGMLVRAFETVSTDGGPREYDMILEALEAEVAVNHVWELAFECVDKKLPHLNRDLLVLFAKAARKYTEPTAEPSGGHERQKTT